ncbi:hypothetical protein LUZ60_012231 [Juncus effusus]|nr:hypothetical protein LUZ60_012231 [Juncus effusus]
MDVNFSIPTFESESSDPFVLSSPILLESELLELLWKKGPIEKPLTVQVPPDPPTLQLGEVEPPFMTEDEMAMWLHYPLEGTGGSGMSTAGQPVEAIVPAAEPVRTKDDAPSTCEEQVGSSNVTNKKRKWKEIAGLQLDTERRRERINEKLKTLQELIPRCSKSDKVSMLGEAIGYVKSLQQLVQMMSMGCNVTPLMFPGAPPPCMSPMGLGMNMNMAGMGMNMNMNNMGLGMAGQAGMGPFGPVLPFNNRAVQETMMQMQHQHNTYPPCHFPFVVPRQVQAPSHNSNHQKTEKGKQAESSGFISFSSKNS